MSRLNLCVRNMASNMVGWVVPVALNVVAVPLLLRRLGPDAYGLSNLVIMLIGYFSILDMGMDIAGVKLLAEYNAAKDSGSISRLMSTKLVMYTCAGLTGMLLTMLLSNVLVTRFFSIPPALRPDAVLVFRFAAVSILANMIISWSSTAPQGVQRYDVFNGITIAISCISTAAGLAAVYLGYGVVGFVFVRVLTNMLAAAGGCVMVYCLLPGLRLRFRIDREMVRNIFSITVFGFMIKIAGMLAGSVDRTLIGVWAGTAAVAAYSVPYMVTTYLNQITLRLMNFVFPMSSEMLQLGQMEELRGIFIRASRFCVAVNTIVILPTIVLADRLLSLWVSANLASISTDTFRLLLLGCYLSSTTALLSYVLIGIGGVKQFTAMFIARTAGLAMMCAVLIHSFGIVGAGLAVLGASLLDVAMGMFSLRAYIKISITRFYGSYARPVGLGVGLSGLLWLARPHILSWFTLIGAMLCYAALYAILGFLVGVFGQTEKVVIAQMLQAPSRLFGRFRRPQKDVVVTKDSH